MASSGSGTLHPLERTDRAFCKGVGHMSHLWYVMRRLGIVNAKTLHWDRVIASIYRAANYVD